MQQVESTKRLPANTGTVRKNNQRNLECYIRQSFALGQSAFESYSRVWGPFRLVHEGDNEAYDTKDERTENTG